MLIGILCSCAVVVSIFGYTRALAIQFPKGDSEAELQYVVYIGSIKETNTSVQSELA